MTNKSIAILIVVILIIVGGYFIFSKRATAPAENQIQQSTPQVDNSGMKTYRSEEYGFEFVYPGNFVVGKYIDEPLPSPDKTREVFEQAGYTQQEIEEKLHPFKNNIVLVERDISKYFDNLQMIPVGKGFGITLKLDTGKNGEFILRLVSKGEKINLGSYTVYTLPGYPGPYGDASFFYVLPVSNNLVIEVTGFKEYPKGNEFPKSGEKTNYDQVIKQILSTFKLIP